MSPFAYCPLVWMFCSRQADNLLNATHFKALRVRFNDFTSSFDNLLKKSESISIHTKNLQLMLSKVYKTLNHLNPPMMWEFFEYKTFNKYSLRRGNNLEIPTARSTSAVNSFDFRAVMAWNQLSDNIKCADTLSEFNTKVRKIKIYCTCVNCTFQCMR